MNNAEVVTVRSVKFSPPFLGLTCGGRLRRTGLLALNHHAPEFAGVVTSQSNADGQLR